MNSPIWECLACWLRADTLLAINDSGPEGELSKVTSALSLMSPALTHSTTMADTRGVAPVECCTTFPGDYFRTPACSGCRVFNWIYHKHVQHNSTAADAIKVWNDLMGFLLSQIKSLYWVFFERQIISWYFSHTAFELTLGIKYLDVVILFSFNWDIPEAFFYPAVRNWSGENAVDSNILWKRCVAFCSDHKWLRVSKSSVVIKRILQAPLVKSAEGNNTVSSVRRCPCLL